MWIALASVTYVLLLIVFILEYAVKYLSTTIQVESFSQLLYTMQVSMGGAENTIFQILQGFLVEYGIWILLLTAFYIYFVRTARKIKKGTYQKPSSSLTRRVVTMNSIAAVGGAAALSMMVMQVYAGYNVLGIEEYLEERSTVSTLYEDHYVPAASDLVQFPQKKKNLVYIYMESMESSYADHQHGGGFDYNLIPNLTKLALQENDFSDDENQINGGRVTTQTSWTVAGITAQTSGTPLGLGNSEYTRNFEDNMEFMPNLTTLGDILQDNGYQNVFLCGSDAAYGGRANYFRQHGDYEIIDWVSKREDGTLPENYKEWWGFEDEKLIEYAKETVTELASRDKPFNLTMLTADTHFKNGYLCEDCPELYDEQYENVIACSDKRIYEFIEWLSQQDFYKDTVVILSGDHLSMDGLIPQAVGSDYQRHTYFTVVNGPKSAQDTKREYTTLDIFPTTLEALGADVEGGRLGLGTSLYGDRATLSEELGFDEFNEQIGYRSNYYDSVILAGDKAAEEDNRIPAQLD